MTPRQISRLSFGVSHWEGAGDPLEPTRFVVKQLRSVLHGTVVEPVEPPQIKLRRCNLFNVRFIIQIYSSMTLIRFRRAQVKIWTERHTISFITAGEFLSLTQQEGITPLFLSQHINTYSLYTTHTLWM